jgi:hypothetical protein
MDRVSGGLDRVPETYAPVTEHLRVQANGVLVNSATGRRNRFGSISSINCSPAPKPAGLRLESPSFPILF